MAQQQAAGRSMKAMVAVVSDSAFKLGTAQREGLACWLWACVGVRMAGQMLFPIQYVR